MFIVRKIQLTESKRLTLKNYMFFRHYNDLKRADLYKKCYQVLGITEDSSQSVVRERYIELVKIVHPDSGHPDSSSDKFTEIDRAFRILQEKYAKERRDIDDSSDPIKVEDFDIKHTAPQHRQYLSYDGFGYGTPSQREKQYQQIRANKAHERVIEYRIDVARASDTDVIKKGGTYFKKHAIKTKYGFDRIVEDLIQEAMSKGDFNNLSGVGKPLSHVQTQNPYVDFTQHKINKILLDNGFCPEWITLQKEIRLELDAIKLKLKKERSYLGAWPLCASDQSDWNRTLEKLQPKIDVINKNIDKYNILVPLLNKQMIRIQLDRIGETILKEDPCFDLHSSKTEKSRKCIHKAKQPVESSSVSSTGLFSFINLFLK